MGVSRSLGTTFRHGCSELRGASGRVGKRHGTNRELANPLGRRDSCGAGPFYDAAVSTTALGVRPDFRFAIWPSPLFFASADRVAAYSGATIG